MYVSDYRKRKKIIKNLIISTSLISILSSGILLIKNESKIKQYFKKIKKDNNNELNIEDFEFPNISFSNAIAESKVTEEPNITLEPTNIVTSTPTVMPTIEPFVTIEPTNEPFDITKLKSYKKTKEIIEKIDSIDIDSLTTKEYDELESILQSDIDYNDNYDLEPTEEVVINPTIEPTEEVVIDPTIEPTEEVVIDPTLEPTEEPKRKCKKSKSCFMQSNQKFNVWWGSGKCSGNGCSLVAATNAIRICTNNSLTPSELNQLGRDGTFNSYSRLENIKDYLEYYDLSYDTLSKSDEELVYDAFNQVKNGEATIIFRQGIRTGKGVWWSKNGHYFNGVDAKIEDSEWYIKIEDPAGNKRNGWVKYSTFKYLLNSDTSLFVIYADPTYKKGSTLVN